MNKKAKPPTAKDLLKLEVAQELGLLDKVNETGWKSLTSRESGRIGGIMNKKLKEMRQVEESK